jgi:hypothetical protein
MNEYKYQLRRKKRGQHCLIHGSGLCGCGHRTPPSKKKKTRIVKRTLQQSLRRDLSQDTTT